MSKTPDEVLAETPEDRRETVGAARDVIAGRHPALTQAVKWGNLTFQRPGGGNVLSLVVHKGWVNLQFFEGAALDDPCGILEGTGKSMRHVKLRSADDVDADALGPLIDQAVGR